MQHLEVSGAVRHIIYIYMYIYMCVIRRLKFKSIWFKLKMSHSTSRAITEKVTES